MFIFSRRVSVTIPPSSGAHVHYDRPWFIFIADFSLITLFLDVYIFVLKVNIITPDDGGGIVSETSREK